MKRRLIIFFSVILIVGILVGGITLACFTAIDYLDYKSKISELEKYKPEEGEVTVKEFENQEKKYVISRINLKYGTRLNILFKEGKKLYLLDKVDSCDITDTAENILINDNKIYIHCIGEEREILEFELNKASIYKSSRYLNYSHTPNTSGAHLNIEKVDKKYLYFYSYVKKDDSIKEGDRIKCSLKTNQCEYNIKQEKKEDKSKAK